MKRLFKFSFSIISPIVLVEQVNAQDFAVSGSLEQSIQLNGIESIEIYCYCPKGFTRKESSDGKLGLSVIGTHDSVGYHGVQKTPKKLSPTLLAFKETREGAALKLESREYTFIHHAFLIDQLELSLPASIDVKMVRVSRFDLEGRQID